MRQLFAAILLIGAIFLAPLASNVEATENGPGRTPETEILRRPPRAMPTSRSLTCPSIDATRSILGIPVFQLSSESCTFQLFQIMTVVCPAGWICTFDESITGFTTVERGPGTEPVYAIQGFFRYGQTTNQYLCDVISTEWYRVSQQRGPSNNVYLRSRETLTCDRTAVLYAPGAFQGISSGKIIPEQLFRRPSSTCPLGEEDAGRLLGGNSYQWRSYTDESRLNRELARLWIMESPPYTEIRAPKPGRLFNSNTPGGTTENGQYAQTRAVVYVCSIAT